MGVRRRGEAAGRRAASVPAQRVRAAATGPRERGERRRIGEALEQDEEGLLT